MIAEPLAVLGIETQSSHIAARNQKQEAALRRILIAIVLSLAATTMPTFAALPPQYQRQAELRAIIESMVVVGAFGFDGIDSIELINTDLYLVKGGACSLEVMIVDLPDTHPEGWVGPREFTIEVTAPVCE